MRLEAATPPVAVSAPPMNEQLLNQRDAKISELEQMLRMERVSMCVCMHVCVHVCTCVL